MISAAPVTSCQLSCSSRKTPQDHPAQRERAGRHGGARRPDLVDLVIGQHEGEARAGDAPEQQGKPR